jgi:hypothetical protein
MIRIVALIKTSLSLMGIYSINKAPKKTEITAGIPNLNAIFFSMLF